MSLKRAGRWREALRLTGDRSTVRVVRSEGTFRAVVTLELGAGILVGVAILVEGCGDAADWSILIVRDEVEKHLP